MGHEAEEVMAGKVTEHFKCQCLEVGFCPEGKEVSFVLSSCFFSLFLSGCLLIPCLIIVISAF